MFFQLLKANVRDRGDGIDGVFGVGPGELRLFTDPTLLVEVLFVVFLPVVELSFLIGSAHKRPSRSNKGVQ